MSDRRSLRLVHTSDVHLGAYSASPRGRDEPRNRSLEEGFQAVVDLACEGADVLLIAGDFFDNARIGQDIVEFAVQEVDRFSGPTVLLPGNHDPIGPGGPYERFDLEQLARRLYLIRDPKGEFVDFPDLDLTIWGRAVTAAVAEQPLSLPPPRNDERGWNVAIAHGHSVNEGVDEERSLRITPDHFAESAHWDYVALGHWELHADVSAYGATAVYSGAPAPLGELVQGVAVDVELGPMGVSWQARALGPGETTL